MAELAHFKNFAKLKDTSVEFNDITVLAGKPGTGKSYVMKFIYAIYDARFKLEKELQYLADNENSNENSNEIEESDFLKEFKGMDISKGFTPIHVQKLSNYLYKNIIQSIFIDFKQISLEWEVQFSALKLFYSEDKFEVTIDHDKARRQKSETLFPQVNNIFVETPLILEFHKHIDRRKAKTPYHIESLINVLDEDYSFTDEEQDELIKSFSKKANNIIGGDIKSRNGSFVFSRNNDKDYNIFNASSGIKSIGLLQYLVTNKALKKGSVLFWEEPEVHLHPSWQLKMVDLFIELMNAGIKIVFSTHSPFMGDYLNAISQRNNYRDRISFNLLKEKNEEVANYILKTDEDWNMIQDELLGSLEDIMWEYL